MSAVTTSCTSPPAETASAHDAALPAGDPSPADERPDDGWESVRSQFDLSDEYVHMGALLISSHPRAVSQAIDSYRQELDRDPVGYLVEHNGELQDAARDAAAAYLHSDASDVALTDSTTMGLGLLYGGLRLGPGQEVLTTSNDYFATHEALRTASQRTGATVREIDVYDHGAEVSQEELAHRVTSAVAPNTRAIALTWVHSSTGVKTPLAAIADALKRLNEGRDAGNRVLLCVDGVHGFGVEHATMEDLGADFFAAGCHKWLFGPRGTGVLWGRGDAWAAVRPTIPSFTDDLVWLSWLQGRDPEGPTTAARVTPGGFKAFEHQWAMPEAFEFHQRIGVERVASRTHALARQLKEGLARMPHVRLITPMDDGLSAGIVCFQVDGMDPRTVVSRLRERRVIGTVTPYASMYARLTPSIVNTEAEIERALQAVHELG